MASGIALVLNRHAMTWIKDGHTQLVYYSDVIISVMASQITGVSSVCSTVCSGHWSKKTSKLRVTGHCKGNPPVTSGFPHKGPIERKMFPFDDLIIMASHDYPLVCGTFNIFLAATKQLYKWYFPSVCLSVRLSHIFHYVPIIVSSWNFQELLSMTNVRSMQTIKVRSQRSRPQRSQPNLTVSGL